MPRMTVACGTLVALLAGCAAVGSGNPETEPVAYRELEPPSEVLGLPMTRVAPQRPASAGIGYHYDAPDLQGPDVFVYSIGPPAAGSDAAAVERERLLFPRVLALQQEQGVFDGFRILLEEDFARTVDGRRTPGHHTVVELRRGRDTVYSHQLLFAMHGRFIKVRTTYAPEVAAAELVRAFGTALVEAMVAMYP